MVVIKSMMKNGKQGKKKKPTMPEWQQILYIWIGGLPMPEWQQILYIWIGGLLGIIIIESYILFFLTS